MTIEKAHGQLCWTLESNDKKLYVTIQGGHLTCDFGLPNQTVNPFYIFPWWNEPVSLEMDNQSQGMRGDFFCFPFGKDDYADPVSYHGPTSSGFWVPVADMETPDSIDLHMPLSQGSVRKHVEVRPGQPVIYQKHTISGFDGAMPFGYHPILRFPEGQGTGRVSMSVPLCGFTTPEALETADTGGYSCTKPGMEILDMTAVPCLDGSQLDVTTYPHENVHEDLVMFVSDPEAPFAFTAVTFPESGYLYFQLKNPQMLRQTILWMSNGGRWYPPWNGRIRGVMGIEEVTAFFHYGRAASENPNFVFDRGYPTSREFSADEDTEVSLISGVAAIEADFGRVESMQQTGTEEIMVFGDGNRELKIPCDTGFLS